MTSIYAEALGQLILILAICTVLAGAGYCLVQTGRMTAATLKRAVAAMVVFFILLAVVYLDAGYVSDVHYLAAVVGGGCCWIGSNPR